MLFFLTKLLTTLVLAPAHNLLLGIFAALSYRLQWRKTARGLLLLSGASLYLLSTPWFADKLQAWQTQYPTLSLEQYRQADAIVVLGGGIRESQELSGDYAVRGISLERLRYGVYLHQQTGLPILATGGSFDGMIAEAQQMANELQQLWQISSVIVEDKARNTAENAKFSRELLQKEGKNKIILVTNRWHMPRSVWLFEQQGFEVMPAAVGGKSDSLDSLYYLPQADALFRSNLILKEWLGLWVEYAKKLG